MKNNKKLLLQRNIFAFIVFVILGVILVTQKAGDIFIPKVEKKFDAYIKENLKDIQNEVEWKEISFQNNKYTKKAISKENKNLSFQLIYSNKKVTDTYQKDYVEGKSLLKKIQKDLKEEIEKETKTEVKINILSNLDQFTSNVKERIIKEENLKELKFYTLEKEILIEDWKETPILEKMEKNVKDYEEKGFTPKSYTFQLIKKDNIKESLKIKNITSEFFENPSKEEILSDILNDKNSKLVKENKITYQYLYEEE